MNVYRGFASMNEALDVLGLGTVGGKMNLPNWTEDTLKEIRNQKTTGGEGVIRIMIENKREAPFIEYTTNPDIAMRFGTLCVIGGIVDEKALIPNINYYPMKYDMECGVFFKSDIPISIQAFNFGSYYLIYKGPKTEKWDKYKPFNTGEPTRTLSKTEQSILSLFIEKVNTFLGADGQVH